MASDLSPCPPPERLADLRANALPTAEAEALRKHLAACPACRAALARAETVSPQHSPNDSASAETVALRDRPGAGAAPESGAVFGFLRPAGGPDELGRLGDYRILRVIGRGGMGIVFESEDVALNRRVALKVLRPDLIDDEFRRRFLREARAAASLPTDHIVTIYQVGEDSGVPYLAMEYLQGQSLETRLGHDGWLPLSDALDIARQTAEGLAAAHEKGLIHRDIKPDNLWLESFGGSAVGRVKLLDFGLARPAHGPSDLTAPGQVVGTPGYMAPEVVYGLAVDSRADLYALGCVLFRMLTGKTPHSGDGLDTRAQLRASAERDAPRADSLAPGLPAPVVELVGHLLSRDPVDRPVSARAVAARLRELERDAHALTAAAQPAAKPRQGPVRLGARLGVWAGAFTVLAAIFVGGTIFLDRAFNQRPGTSSEPEDANAAAAPAGEPVRVGLLYSLSGTLAYSEKPVRGATLLAIREINDAGGVLGRRIEPVTQDGGSNEEAFERAAEELLTGEKAVTLFGCWSSSSRKRVGQVCARHNRLLVYAVPDEGLEEHPFIFNLGATPNQLMAPAVRYAYGDLGKRRFFLAGSSYVFCKAANAILAHEVRNLGGTVVGEVYRPLGDQDFASVADEVKRSGADVVLCTVDGLSNVAFAQALRDRGLRPPAVPTFWFNVSENELRYMHDPKQMAGDFAPFCYFQSLETPANRAFLARFREGLEDPTVCVTDPMEASYSAVYLWKQAVEAAGTTDTGPLREAFKRQSFDAPEGKITIDPGTQRAWRTPRIGRVNDRLDFDVVWAAPGPVPPVPFPYPKYRTRQQWEDFLQDIYKGWGGHWEEHPR